MISDEVIRKQIKNTLEKTNFTGLGKKYEGKVRDNYSFDGKRILITTDRISAFDRVLGTIPFKGQVLNQLAVFWFQKTKDIVNNHLIKVIDTNVILAKECKPIPVEMVVRGYITGVTTTSAWYNYERGVRNFCGNILPEGLKKNQKFDNPITTPSTKAEHGKHDISISREEIIKKKIVPEKLYKEMEEASLKLFERGTEICAKNGLILVDTKYEFGFDKDNKLTLIDEIHTPDSSRFWVKENYQELFEQGEEPEKLDKEYVRQWLADKGFIGEGIQPPLTDEVKIEAAKKYIKAFEMISGQKFKAANENVLERIKRNLEKEGLL